MLLHAYPGQAGEILPEAAGDARDVALLSAVSLCFAYASYKLGVFQTRGGYAREITAFVSFYGVNFAANWP